jgi:membrane fusion protein, multidrug efflux system
MWECGAMNPIVFAMRRPLLTLLVVVALVSGGVLGSSKMRADIVPSISTPKIHGYLDSLGMRAEHAKEYIVKQYEKYFHKSEAHHEEARKVVVTSPKVMDVTISKPYVCQIHSQRHIEIKALEGGYLLEIFVQEGQAVKKGDVMFKIVQTLYQAKLNAETAEARLAALEWQNTENLFKKGAVVSQNEVALFEAKRDRAKAKADQAQAEFDWTNVKAPFDGIVDRLLEREGSLIKEGDILTTLSDNSLMWVYFNVPEAAYFEYMARKKQGKNDDRIELELANHDKFPEPGKIGAVEAKFNNETGNILFRADFLNPDRLLRHGQTGTIWIHRKLKDALVIPQRATFELLDKRYVWVIDDNDVAHQSLITIKYELDDIFVIKSGITVNDKIVLEGVRQVEQDQKVEYEFRKPEEALSLKNQKFRAE